MRRFLFLAGFVAAVVMQAPADADARPGARSLGARFAPSHRPTSMRYLFNRALARRLNLPCHNARRVFGCR
jgi:hypothetical protein